MRALFPRTGNQVATAIGTSRKIARETRGFAGSKSERAIKTIAPSVVDAALKAIAPTPPAIMPLRMKPTANSAARDPRDAVVAVTACIRTSRRRRKPIRIRPASVAGRQARGEDHAQDLVAALEAGLRRHPAIALAADHGGKLLQLGDEIGIELRARRARALAAAGLVLMHLAQKLERRPAIDVGHDVEARMDALDRLPQGHRILVRQPIGLAAPGQRLGEIEEREALAGGAPAAGRINAPLPARDLLQRVIGHPIGHGGAFDRSGGGTMGTP